MKDLKKAWFQSGAYKTESFNDYIKRVLAVY